jgi:hypothetical protein
MALLLARLTFETALSNIFGYIKRSFVIQLALDEPRQMSAPLSGIRFFICLGLLLLLLSKRKHQPFPGLGAAIFNN